MKIIKKYFVLVLVIITGISVFGCNKDPLAQYEKMLKNGDSSKINIWTYYNNTQKSAFDEIVATFNRTIGKDKNITVTHTAFQSTNALAIALENSANSVVGSEDVPNIFQSYADDLMNLDTKHANVAALDKYFTTAEINTYLEGLLEEGRYDKNRSLKLIPVAKSTEIFMLNKTDWDKYAALHSVSLSDLDTMEGLATLAENYYKNTGAAFYGRDSLANMIYVNAVAQNKPLFSIDQETNNATITFDKEFFRKLYDNHYVPFVKGYFATKSNFHTGDIASGLVISCIGSTAGIAYFPKQVAATDVGSENYSITGYVAAPQLLAGSEKYVLLQGAGMAVRKADEKTEYASSVFLKYLSAPENNIKFAVSMSYLPVTKDSLDYNVIKEAFINIKLEAGKSATPAATRESILADPINIIVLAGYSKSIDVLKTYRTYSPTPFNNSAVVRRIIDKALEGTKEAGMESLINATDMLKLIEQDVALGASREQAIEARLDGNFEVWYNALKALVEDAVKVG